MRPFTNAMTVSCSAAGCGWSASGLRAFSAGTRVMDRHLRRVSHPGQPTVKFRLTFPGGTQTRAWRRTHR
ncbi:hypothetical protein [Nocardioides bruguierae]|uniref:hypothetical protein n=1 Tax=Nocardioides bruguierae TaxID=2945102 RepID=UPI00201FD497|nr:hypothetical protein [Nocardioides bruguierae]MCL8026970.1 hypothetical protein [Nocardioides bruguierae]